MKDLLRCLSVRRYDEANFEMLVVSRYIARAVIVLHCPNEVQFSLCMQTECNVININQQKSQNGPLWNSSY